MGKVYEHISDRRLRAWMTTEELWDPFQFDYRKDHSITQSLLYYTLSVIQGFKEGKHTLACFIDLEGAFDTVWRASIIYKLYQAGLTGRLLCYIDSYLRDRLVRNQVNDYILDWFSSLLTQGSVIAPLLFVCWIRDMSTNIGQHIGYADDLTNWITTVHLSKACEEMGRNLAKMSVWCKRWRATINVPKTDYIVHSREGHQQVAVYMGNTPLVQVDVLDSPHPSQ